MSKSLLVIAGEVSGDMHAARVIRELRERDTDVACWGIGGDELAAAGVKLRYDLRDMAVLGLWEVLKRYLFFRVVLSCWHWQKCSLRRCFAPYRVPALRIGWW